jgi:hypothetical protein
MRGQHTQPWQRWQTIRRLLLLLQLGCKGCCCCSCLCCCCCACSGHSWMLRGQMRSCWANTYCLQTKLAGSQQGSALGSHNLLLLLLLCRCIGALQPLDGCSSKGSCPTAGRYSLAFVTSIE